jgi:hypothetical protein
MRRSFPQLILGLLAAPLLLIASTASAAPGKEACDNLELVGSGSCVLEVSGGCTAKCTPVSFDLACNGKCSVTASASCTTQCSVDCNGQCTVNPGTFDCSADCSASCTGDCDASCKGSADGTHCKAQCQGSCDTSCKAKCGGTPPSATCQAKCDASCSGSCDVKADVDCHVSCEADLKGGCETQCSDPKGALFCDGQYVDAANLDDCLAYLASINITVDASGSVKCTNGNCNATGQAAVGCSTQPVGSAPLDVGAIATMVVGLGFVVSRRRRS